MWCRSDFRISRHHGLKGRPFLLLPRPFATCSWDKAACVTTPDSPLPRPTKWKDRDHPSETFHTGISSQMPPTSDEQIRFMVNILRLLDPLTGKSSKRAGGH